MEKEKKNMAHYLELTHKKHVFVIKMMIIIIRTKKLDKVFTV